MDPTSNLSEIRALVVRMTDNEDNPNYLDDSDRLAQLVGALDEWISKGGFLPSQWKK